MSDFKIAILRIWIATCFAYPGLTLANEDELPGLNLKFSLPFGEGSAEDKSNLIFSIAGQKLGSGSVDFDLNNNSRIAMDLTKKLFVCNCIEKAVETDLEVEIFFTGDSNLACQPLEPKDCENKATCGEQYFCDAKNYFYRIGSCLDDLLPKVRYDTSALFVGAENSPIDLANRWLRECTPVKLAK